MVPAMSKLPIGVPNTQTIYTYKNEDQRITNSKKRIPKYFPSTICSALIGLVNNKVNIPLLFSSEILLIVRAGTKKTNIQEERRKKDNKSAKPALKML